MVDANSITGAHRLHKRAGFATRYVARRYSLVAGDL